MRIRYHRHSERMVFRIDIKGFAVGFAFTPYWLHIQAGYTLGSWVFDVRKFKKYLGRNARYLRTYQLQICGLQFGILIK